MARSKKRKPIILPWYMEREFTEDQCYQFFSELKELSKEFVKYNTNIMRWPSSPLHTSKFVPKGVVVHSSKTKTLKQTLEVNNTGSFSSHFIILSEKHNAIQFAKKYPLAATIPTNIIMPYNLNEYTPHSGYLSPVTWGVELRTIGQVRPSEENFVSMIEDSEINSESLKLWLRSPLYYFWRDAKWTTPFEHDTYTWQGYHYEKPRFNQLISLFVLVKCLWKLRELNPALVLPSSAVNGTTPELPILPFDHLQNLVGKMKNRNIDFRFDGIKKLKSIYKEDKLSYKELDDYDSEMDLVSNLTNENMWKTERDSGKLAKLFTHGNTKYPKLYKYKKAFGALGYSTNESYFTKSVILYANSKNLDETDEDLLLEEIEKDFYYLVNGSYNE